MVSTAANWALPAQSPLACQKCCKMHERQQCESCNAAFKQTADGGSGPFANGESWYDTVDGCDCAELMILAFGNMGKNML